MKFYVTLTFVLFFTFSLIADAKNKSIRKTQEVNFNEVDLEGKVRNPDGAFMVQKKGIQFVPLYEMKSKFDRNIKDSAYVLR